MQRPSSRLPVQPQRQLLDRALVKVKYGIIGAGAVSDFHRKPARDRSCCCSRARAAPAPALRCRLLADVPGIDVDPRAQLVMVADPMEELLAKREKDWAPIRTTTDYKELISDPEVTAVCVERR